MVLMCYSPVMDVERAKSQLLHGHDVNIMRPIQAPKVTVFECISFEHDLQPIIRFLRHLRHFRRREKLHDFYRIYFSECGVLSHVRPIYILFQFHAFMTHETNF